jgi:hypothetical protein
MYAMVMQRYEWTVSKLAFGGFGDEFGFPGVFLGVFGAEEVHECFIGDGYILMDFPAFK